MVDSESEMAEAIGRLDEIDTQRCRESAAERFDVTAVAAAYADAYWDVIARAEPVGV